LSVLAAAAMAKNSTWRAKISRNDRIRGPIIICEFKQFIKASIDRYIPIVYIEAHYG